MKRKMMISTLLVIITLILNINNVYAKEELNIDSNSLKTSENDAYMSVLDIYGVELFTDKVSKVKDQVKNQEKQKTEDLYNSIFLSKNDITSLKSEQLNKKVEDYSLFVKPKIEKKIRYAGDSYSINIINISIIIFLCILTGVLTRMYYIYKSKGEEKRSEYNNYTGL